MTPIGDGRKGNDGGEGFVLARFVRSKTPVRSLLPSRLAESDPAKGNLFPGPRHSCTYGMNRGHPYKKLRLLVRERSSFFLFL